jgi:hypothetical protein
VRNAKRAGIAELASSAGINVLKAGTKEELGIEMFDVRSLMEKS